MFCVSCGNQLPNDAIFCNYCGKRTVQSSSENLPTIQNPTNVTIQLSETMQANAAMGTPPSVPWSGSVQQADSQPLASWRSPVSAVPPTVSTAPLSQPIFQNVSFPNPSSPQYPGYPGYPVSAPLTPPSATATAPVSLLPPTAFQRLLVTLFQPALASSAWLGIGLGGVIALVGSALVIGLVLAITHALLPNRIDEVFLDLGIFNLQNSFRDTLQLLMVALGTGTHYQYTSNGTIETFTAISPLDGLLFIPALFLIWGGYIAASTDFQNRIRVSLVRGVAVAIPYTLLLLVAVAQVNGGIPDNDGIIRPDSPVLSMNIPTLLLFGLLWGGLFGLLGATVKLSYGQWRLMIRTFVQTSRRSQLLGMSLGAVFALCLGVALSLLVLWSVVAYTSFSSPLLHSSALCLQTGWQDLTLWSISQGPIHAVNLFAFSYGSPIVVSNPAGNACFYTSLPHVRVSIFDPVIQHFRWLYALLVLPTISLFFGGRVSVAASRVREPGPAMLQGAFIAIPFTLLMVVVCLISSINYTETLSAGRTFTGSAGVDIFTMLLWSLLSGAIFGALGGLYQASALSNSVHRVLALLVSPLLWIGRPIVFVLNAVTGQHRKSTASTARLFLYAALISAILLAIACGIVGSMLINLNQIIDFQENQHTLNILDVLTVAIPSLFIVTAGAVALTADPSADVQSATTQHRSQLVPDVPMAIQEEI